MLFIWLLHAMNHYYFFAVAFSFFVLHIYHHDVDSYVELKSIFFKRKLLKTSPPNISQEKNILSCLKLDFFLSLQNFLLLLVWLLLPNIGASRLWVSETKFDENCKFQTLWRISILWFPEFFAFAQKKTFSQDNNDQRQHCYALCKVGAEMNFISSRKGTNNRSTLLLLASKKKKKKNPVPITFYLFPSFLSVFHHLLLSSLLCTASLLSFLYWWQTKHGWSTI